ncbi:hypothetical protein [Candidatus Cryosericum septentrionale]|uniref:hypothetical protein n=1 Tax=Candidatus Cryosericum septentrionale TaxID=2290913 RepID=UPI000F887618|nr:hypothetical protein [Candidatus Cryosericum septentrionale]
MSDFRKRWSMTQAPAETIEEFRNRAFGSVSEVLGGLILDDPSISAAFLHALGEPVSSDDWEYISKPTETPLWHALERRTTLPDFLFGLEVLFHIELNAYARQQLAQLLRKDVAASGVPVLCAESNGCLIFYPEGAQLLDEQVVNADLAWLGDYPEALKAFSEALALYGSSGEHGHMLNCLRVCIEELARKLLGNDSSLEKNTVGLLALLEPVLSKETRNMTHQLLDYYAKYQNEHVKHHDDWTPVEVAFILYLTATFVYLLVTARREESHD